MPVVRGTLNRQDFPAGRQGESLVIDPNTPHGIAWRQRATQAYADGVVLDRAYFAADKTFSGVTGTSLAGVTDNWLAVLTGWNVREASDWEETSSGTTGEFKYTGSFPASGIRKFLVTYNFTVYAAFSRLFVKVLGRVTKDTGSGHAVVAGSFGDTSWYGYLAYLGYHYVSHLSWSCLVSMQSDDVISFQLGTYGSGAATYNLSGMNTQQGNGVAITIVPADIVT